MAATSVSFLQKTSPGSSVSLAEKVTAGVVMALAAPGLVAVLGVVGGLSGRPPLVAHLRVGQFGRPLWVFKVRTMWDDRDSRCPRNAWVEYLRDPIVPQSKAAPDARVTSQFAAFCRRQSIDELPQLLHIAAGTMSWVGPRPMTQAELDEYYAEVQAEVLSVPPGLTGLWQVSGRNRLTYPQRRRLDRFLVRHLDWRLRASVLLRTVKEVVLPRYAW